MSHRPSATHVRTVNRPRTASASLEQFRAKYFPNAVQRELLESATSAGEQSALGVIRESVQLLKQASEPKTGNP
jgi:hypothetical protein